MFPPIHPKGGLRKWFGCRYQDFSSDSSWSSVFPCTHYAVCSPLTPGGTSYQPLQRSFLQPSVPSLAQSHGYLVVRIEPVLNLALTSGVRLFRHWVKVHSQHSYVTWGRPHNCKLKSQQWTISHMHTRIDIFIQFPGKSHICARTHARTILHFPPDGHDNNMTRSTSVQQGNRLRALFLL